MDDTIPRLIGLLLAAAIAMLGLRDHLGDAPSGRRTFGIVLLIFLGVIAFAVYALLRGPDGALPVIPPDAPTTVA